MFPKCIEAGLNDVRENKAMGACAIPAFSHSFHHVLLPRYMKVCTHAPPVEILKNLEHLHLQDLGIYYGSW